MNVPLLTFVVLAMASFNDAVRDAIILVRVNLTEHEIEVGGRGRLRRILWSVYQHHMPSGSEGLSRGGSTLRHLRVVHRAAEVRCRPLCIALCVV